MRRSQPGAMASAFQRHQEATAARGRLAEAEERNVRLGAEAAEARSAGAASREAQRRLERELQGAKVWLRPRSLAGLPTYMRRQTRKRTHASHVQRLRVSG